MLLSFFFFYLLRLLRNWMQRLWLNDLKMFIIIKLVAFSSRMFCRSRCIWVWLFCSLFRLVISGNWVSWDLLSQSGFLICIMALLLWYFNLECIRSWRFYFHLFKMGMTMLFFCWRVHSYYLFGWLHFYEIVLFWLLIFAFDWMILNIIFSYFKKFVLK